MSETSKTSTQQTLTMGPSVIRTKDYTEIRLPSLDVNGRWYTREIKVYGECLYVDIGRDQA